MEEQEQHSPWICHVCDAVSNGASRACMRCYMTTCARHLQTVSVLNAHNGLYELQQVCVWCLVKDGE